MKTNILIYPFLLRYGISAVLVVMMISIGFILKTIEIQNKTAVDVLWSSGTQKYTAFVDKNSQFHPEPGQQIEVDTSDKVKLYFKIETVKEEPSFFVLSILSQTDASVLTSVFAGNTKLSGYIFTNNIQLWDLIFNKWSDLHP